MHERFHLFKHHCNASLGSKTRQQNLTWQSQVSFISPASGVGGGSFFVAVFASIMQWSTTLLLVGGYIYLATVTNYMLLQHMHVPHRLIWFPIYPCLHFVSTCRAFARFHRHSASHSSGVTISAVIGHVWHARTAVNVSPCRGKRNAEALPHKRRQVLGLSCESSSCKHWL